MKKSAVIIGSGIAAVVVLAVSFSRIPDPEDILAASNMAQLDCYYDAINEAYLNGKLTEEEYDIRYQAYVERFYILLGGI